MKKIISVLLIVVCLGLSNVTVNATQNGQWIKTNGKYWYEYTDKTYPVNTTVLIDGKYYAFDQYGYMITGWYQDNIGWYYHLSSGERVIGQWLQIGNYWYYFTGNESDNPGLMVSNTELKIDNNIYRFTSSGAMYTGWLQINNTWYYYESSGAKVTGWRNISGRRYYFDSDYRMQTGWLQLDNTWYYLNSDGSMHTGWLSYYGNWYYFKADGTMATGGWNYISGKWYYLDDNGIMQTGWLQLDNTWYYLNSDGSMQTGWLSYNGNWYYFKADGTMATGSWNYISGKWYYLDDNGIMQTGWLQLDNNWYYLNSDGSMHTGWLSYNGNWYYFKADGSMATGWTLVGSKWYFLLEDGRMVSSAYVDGYLLGPDGAWIQMGPDDAFLGVDASTGQYIFGKYDRTIQNQIFSSLNSYRASNGISQLKQPSKDLQEAADIRAAELFRNFSHTRPDGSDFYTVYENAYGENIAGTYNYGGASEAMNLWKNSPPHNENMLDTYYNTVGIGVVTVTINGTTYYYYVQLFGIE